MGVYEKVQSAKTSQAVDYFEPEHEWIVLVNQVKDFETRAKTKAFIVECKVLESTCERARPGVDRSEYIDMTQDPSPGNVKHFVQVAGLVLTGLPIEDKDISEGSILEICSPRQPFAGIILGLHTRWNKKQTFTLHKWRALSDEQVKKYEAVAVQLGLRKAA